MKKQTEEILESLPQFEFTFDMVRGGFDDYISYVGNVLHQYIEDNQDNEDFWFLVEHKNEVTNILLAMRRDGYDYDYMCEQIGKFDTADREKLWQCIFDSVEPYAIEHLSGHFVRYFEMSYDDVHSRVSDAFESLRGETLYVKYSKVAQHVAKLATMDFTIN